MTGYIINPSWFYWLNVVDAIGTFFGVIVVVSIGGMIASTIGYLICHSCITDYPDKSDGERARLPVWKRILKISIITAAVAGVFLVFIPSKSTLIEMQIARYATYENAEWTVETIKAAVDYIVEAINSLK